MHKSTVVVAQVAILGLLVACLTARPSDAQSAPPSRPSLAPTAVEGGDATGVVDPAVREAGAGSVAVILRTAGDPGALAQAVVRLGGRVTRPLPIVEGLAATVPAEAVDRLARFPGVRAVTLDRPMHVAEAATASTPVRSVYRRVVRADRAEQAGLTGDGVTVAVVDTGIADVPDLADRLVPVTDDLFGQTAPCKDLSGEDDCVDSYGHGTFMAGLIAGTGHVSDGAHRGVAPAARLVSVKVAGRDGSSDVSTVLAAIQWVVSFRDRYDIRVLNLSLGTDGTQTYETDPLNYAVQRAWQAGIVVVVSAGNLGPGEATVMKPGDDPWVVTAGAIDDRGTPGLGDDVLPNFSARGPTAADGFAKPDVVAPGGHVLSLQAPGSTIEQEHPSTVGPHYRRGSGTSMAAAIVSGAAALALEADPGMTPDRVKHALVATARPAASDDPMAVGSGVVDAHAAALLAPSGRANRGLDRSSGMGSLDASRGTVRVQTHDPLGTVVEGMLTAQLLLWDPVAFVTGDWSASTWYSTSWHTAGLYTTSWHGRNWHGRNWHGATSYGEPVPASYGRPSVGGAWYGAWE